MEQGGLKVLMISSDRNILVPGSAVSERMKDYGRLVDELHIVLESDKAHGLIDTELEKNVWVYPTNSSLRWLRPLDAAGIGKRIVVEKKFVRGKSVITTQDPFECGYAGRKIKNKWRIPLEVQLHTDPFSPYFKGALNSLRKRIAAKVLRDADTIRVVTEPLKQLLMREYALDKDHIAVLPIYVDTKKIENGRVTFDLHARYGWRFILLSVARLTSEKNLSLALKAFAQVHDEFPDAGYVIVGAGPEEGALKRLAQKLGVLKHVAFAGWHEDLASYYKTSNAYIQTSHFEGYGLSLVEAGLSGLPVVTTAVGIAGELTNGKDAFICPPEAEAVAGAVIDLIKHNPKREQMRAELAHTLRSKLISMDEYLKRLKMGWEKTATHIES